MKKVVFIIQFFALLGCTVEVMAQSSVGDIYISVIQPERAEIPQEVSKQLETKMHQLITANGALVSG